MRFVLKSMISASNQPSAVCVIKSLSMIPLRIPNGRRKRKLNSLHNPASPDRDWEGGRRGDGGTRGYGDRRVAASPLHRVILFLLS